MNRRSSAPPARFSAMLAGDESGSLDLTMKRCNAQLSYSRGPLIEDWVPSVSITYFDVSADGNVLTRP